jgi:tRNA A37 threonylcarbamoyladenosine modification protein TsaB
MKFATGSGVPLIALSALTAAAQAEDVLHSKRMVKRGIDADGNYNICKRKQERGLETLLLT